MARILVIDDDAAIVELLRERLEGEGHQVFTGMDASAGMMLAAREKPDLITLDFQMPAGDGAKVYERVRANMTARIPIIFVTATNHRDLELSVRGDPKVRFLQKPIDMGALNGLIAELLGAPAPKPGQPESGEDVLDLDAP